MRARRRIAAAVVGSGLCFGALAASAEVAEADTVRQRSWIIDRGTGYAYSGGNVVIGDASTSSGGTSTSSGTATVTSGTATSTGSWSFSFIYQSIRR